MNGKIRRFQTVPVLLLMVLSSMVVIGIQDDGVVERPPSRIGGDLLVNGTVRFDERTGSPQFDVVRFLDNGRLEIINVTLTAEQMICADGLLNTSLVIQGNDVDNAIVSIRDGLMSVRADEILVRKASISIRNVTDPKPNEQDGWPSTLFLYSGKKDMVIEDAQISVEGELGGRGTSTNAGDGGRAEVTILTGPGKKLDIIRSRIDLKAGTGGDASGVGIQSGKGADSKLRIVTSQLSISGTRITSRGGNAGSPGENSVGNRGGQATVDLQSKETITIFDCEMEAENGRNTDNSQQAGSNMFFRSEDGAVLWDVGKQGEDLTSTLSSLKGFTVQVDAELGSEFHQVDVGENPPIPYGGTRVEVFWWAFLTITDSYGTPIEGAAVNYFKYPDLTTSYPLPPTLILTDENGKASLEVVGVRDGAYPTYVFRAELPEGAQNRSDQTRFDQNLNREITIKVTTLTIKLLQPDIKRTLGGVVEFGGTATTLSAQNIMKAVTLFVDGQLIGEAVDRSAVAAPPFSEWGLSWDSTRTQNGPHTLKIVGRDNKYIVTVTYPIFLNQTAINHRPVLLRMTAVDSLNTTIVDVRSKMTLEVDQQRSVINFKATAWDRDARSEYLGPGEGRVIDYAEVKLVFVKDGTVALTKQIVVSKDNKVNETGGYEFSFQVDANKKQGSSQPFDEGLYRLEVNVRDDAKVFSVDSFILFDLIFNFYPKIIIVLDPQKTRPVEDNIEDFFGWAKLETQKSSKLKLVFNLTESYDYDDALHSDKGSWRNLTWKVRVVLGSKEWSTVQNAKGIAQFEHSFDLRDVPDKTEGKFYMYVEVKDSEGLLTEETYLVRIKHIKAEEPFKIIPDPYNIEYGPIIVLFPVLFVVLVLAYLGIGLFFSMKARSEGKRKLDLIEKKKEEERAKGTSAIEDELSSGYMKDSKRYLETTKDSKRGSIMKVSLDKTGAKASPAVQPPKEQEPPKEAPLSDDFLAHQEVKPPTPEEPEAPMLESFGTEGQPMPKIDEAAVEVVHESKGEKMASETKAQIAPTASRAPPLPPPPVPKV